MKRKKEITSEEIKEWFEDASKQEMKTVASFMKHLMNDYKHDYKTKCYAIATALVAVASAMSNELGATGNQAIVTRLFIQKWYKPYNEIGFRLVDYDEMLYPQYKTKFDKTITKATFEKMQEKAKENLKLFSDRAAPKVSYHWEKIIEGIVPFGYEVINND